MVHGLVTYYNFTFPPSLPPPSHMRLDTVGQILTYSNVHARSNMLIMETTQGLLLTAVLERMGGERGVELETVFLALPFSYRIWQPGTGFLWRLSSQVRCIHQSTDLQLHLEIGPLWLFEIDTHSWSFVCIIL